MKLSTVVCTYNPDPGRLRRTLESLVHQKDVPSGTEILLIDNASTSFPEWAAHSPGVRVVHESAPGLSHARRRGLQEATGDIIILADDDNVLAPDYLKTSALLMQEFPSLGALGGKSLPEFEEKPESWLHEFEGLLALRNPGEKPVHASWNKEYPLCSPIGAGMVLRRKAVQAWLDNGIPRVADRKGSALSSGGDNDIVLHILKAGWEVAYDPRLVLTHLIPAARIRPEYLARLNRGIQKSWMQVLTLHGINPWPPIPSWTVLPRKIKAWFAYRAWSSTATRIRWQGACGHFEGRAA